MKQLKYGTTLILLSLLTGCWRADILVQTDCQIPGVGLELNTLSAKGCGNTAEEATKDAQADLEKKFKEFQKGCIQRGGTDSGYTELETTTTDVEKCTNGDLI